MNLEEILQIVVIPIVLALIALFWPAILNWSRRRIFRSLILRELAEISPHPATATLEGWWRHQNKRFVHRQILGDVKTHRDFVLSLEPDLVYYVTQLWQSLEDQDWEQWYYCLECLSIPKYDKAGRIGKARARWKALYDLYRQNV